MVVSRTRIIFVVGAVLLWAGTPVVVCLMPCLSPAPAKQECPHKMATHCEYSVMPVSRSCCQGPSRPETILTEGQASQSLKHVLAAVPVIAHISLPEVLTTPLVTLAFFESPPAEAPPLSSSVLKI